ncbi:MAG: carbon-nitrogen hydrolase family protein, partial [Chlorobi bacterium]|nr:carbon-nitrogen hydrolase family protein [Chlorobiota bacterium]
MRKNFSISIIVLFLEVILYNNSFTQSNPLSILDSNGVHLRVAAAQFQLQPDLDANLKKINHFLDLAIKKNVDLIVFPELALTGYPPRDYTSISYIHQDTTEEAMEMLQTKAKNYSIAISIGVGWKDENGMWRNRAYFIDDKGKILEYYDKVQQTSHERKFFVDGNRLPTFEWKGVHLGMLICMDMRYPELWRLLRKQEAGLVLHLLSAYGGSTWKTPVLTGTIRGHAASNGYFIVSCNNAGPAPMVNSAIYNPRGM